VSVPSTRPPQDAAHVRAHRTALLRSALVLLAWLATWPLRPHGGTTRLALDGALALMGWWAVRPGRRAGGRFFGEDGHWTSLLIALPIGFAIAAAAEAWHLLRSR
jgi:hypothetical protein